MKKFKSYCEFHNSLHPCDKECIAPCGAFEHHMAQEDAKFERRHPDAVRIQKEKQALWVSEHRGDACPF